MTAHNGIRVRLAPGPRVIASAPEAINLPSPPEWMKGANCQSVDPEIFHREKGESNLAAKKVCGNCDVLDDCLEYALGRGERFGIFGGLSPRQRLKLERDRRAAEGLIHCRICDDLFDGGPQHRDCSEECRTESRRRRNAKHRRTA
jgi:WhiB family redox-sensing transcriptional regulator